MASEPIHHPELVHGLELLPCAIRDGMLYIPHPDGNWVTAAKLQPFSLAIIECWRAEQVASRVGTEDADAQATGEHPRLKEWALAAGLLDVECEEAEVRPFLQRFAELVLASQPPEAMAPAASAVLVVAELKVQP